MEAAMVVDTCCCSGSDDERAPPPAETGGGGRRKPWHASDNAYTIWNEVHEQLKTALPALVYFVLSQISWPISLRFVGVIGTDELAAAALASSLCNVTGLSISYGLTSALSTLTAQARGDLRARRDKGLIIGNEQGKNDVDDDERSRLLVTARSDDDDDTPATLYQSTNFGFEQEDNGEKSGDCDDSGVVQVPLLPLVYLYRGLFIEFVFVIPLGLWWIAGIEPLLLYLGQEPTLSSMTEQYLRVLAPSLWGASVTFTLTAWLQAIEMSNVPAVASAVGLALHVPFNVLFIYVLDWGYLGAAAATVMLQLVQSFIMVAYAFASTSGRNGILEATAADAVGRKSITFWIEVIPAVSSVSGIVQYLKLAVPGIVLVSEWWASEVAIFLAGKLSPSPELSLGAMAIYQSINSISYMIPVAWSVAGATRVGNLLGAGDAVASEFAATVSVSCSAIFGMAVGCLLFFTPHEFFPSLFAPEQQDLLSESSRTITLLSVYVFADGIQCVLNGIIKACGRQPLIMPIVVFAYWVVGLPAAYYVAFVRHGGFMCRESYFCGTVGLVAGMTLGTWVHMLLLAFVVIATTNWQVETTRAKDRVNQS